MNRVNTDGNKQCDKSVNISSVHDITPTFGARARPRLRLVIVWGLNIMEPQTSPPQVLSGGSVMVCWLSCCDSS